MTVNITDNGDGRAPNDPTNSTATANSTASEKSVTTRLSAAVSGSRRSTAFAAATRQIGPAIPKIACSGVTLPAA